ncbi:MAG TPA: S8 family serine peptidase, partial [Solirubrobacterales bacterium]|nr:S8 family serine peptidase [Solirubrobacterales bacterium]
MRGRTVLLALAVAALAVAPTARADFPYTYDGTFPNDVGGEEFKLAGSRDSSNGPLINSSPVENFGIRGARVVDPKNSDPPDPPTAWQLTTGRPDVTIAVMDSGVKWNDAGAMTDLRAKTRLNRAELPVPLHDRGTPLEGAKPCSAYADAYDANGDTVFDVRDYACDSRIDLGEPRRVGPPGVLIPQDILIAFSDGTDPDGNGYVDDIVGWDFLDNDNDPFDDVSYGHGTGEAQGSSGEVDNGSSYGTCPNCRVIHMRVGDSFIADINRFAQGVLYAADNDVQVVQSALGTLNNSTLARQAVDYAYRHGTTTVLSAADEAAQHDNQPYLPHSILVNSVTHSPIPAGNRSYLAFNGCTNFNAKITLAIPSTSCSSDAVGLSSGYAGLIYSAAYEAADAGVLAPVADTALCQTVRPNPVTDDDHCVITPNEVRQVLASGRIAGPGPGGVGFAPLPADPGEGYQAEDVNFAGTPPQGDAEPACAPVALPGCTNPNGAGGALQAQVDANRESIPTGIEQTVMRSYPARAGHDQYYGYGRVNVRRAVEAVLDDPAAPGTPRIPPSVEIDSPEWNQQVDPGSAAFTVAGRVSARDPGTGESRPFTCQVLVAPGHYPNNRLTSQTPPGDYAPVGNGACDGTTPHDGPLDGPLASIDIAALRARFPADTQALGFAGREPGAQPQVSNGRPANDPYGFVVKVVARVDQTAELPAMTGEDQRAAYLHRDQDMLPGFPKGITRGAVTGGPPTSDGESSPALADLDGDNRNELILAGSDGFVHALRPDGSELPGWPVRGDQPPLHTGARAFASGEVPTDYGGPILASVAVADANRDGIPEVFAADFHGRVYGWDAEGHRIFREESEIAYSGKPLAPFENVRFPKSDPSQAELRRTQHGFIASPVIADLDGQGGMEVVIPAMDRHLYAWHLDGTPVDGFPVLVVDFDKVASVDPVTHALTFKPGSGAAMQGAIVDTPALADLNGDGLPEVVVGTNEEYDAAADGGSNAAPPNGSSLSLLDQVGAALTEVRQGCSEGGGPDALCDNIEAPLGPANTRLFAIHPDGDAHPGDADAYLPGWPAKLAILDGGLLPVVGEGVTGYPVVARATCPSGGEGQKIGALANNGPVYVFNADGSSCYGEDGSGHDVPLQSDGYASQPDHPMFGAVGSPAFGRLEGGPGAALVAPAAGLQRALDVAFPEYQPLGQDFLAAWSVEGGGQLRPNFPQPVNDLQFLTGPSIADLDGLPGQEMIEGTASKDLQAFTAAGAPVSQKWPKPTTDWTVANPTVGSWGTHDTDAGARKIVVA